MRTVVMFYLFGLILVTQVSRSVSFQRQFQTDVVAEVIFRGRETERFVLLDRTARHAADQFHLRLVPETDIGQSVLVVDVGAITAQ